MEVKIRENGVVTYWSVYQQVWVTAMACDVPDRELAAMSAMDRSAVELMAALCGEGGE